MIISGIMILMLDSIMRERRYEEMEETVMPAERRTDIKGGAVVMIGPLPVVIGSDQRMAAVLMVLAITLMAIWMVSAYLGHFQ
ncbi:Protein of unknown function DUF131 [Methanothrix thermoacetophila PT]|jgi:uncharacterized protein (TIGR00304 family)|uniref:TIGR00304 family protein n=2 Tax=Methanothrix TaxID=2222 RepID=A0B7P5_METTP|nr:Protein of unknown function DUF131 [Methanothrix thermoacetophila PT]